MLDHLLKPYIVETFQYSNQFALCENVYKHGQSQNSLISAEQVYRENNDEEEGKEG